MGEAAAAGRQQQQQQQQQLERRSRRSLFPKLAAEQAMNPGFDGPDHYGHWKLFRQRRTMATDKQQLVLSHMKRGLRQRLDRRIAAIEEQSDSRDGEAEPLQELKTKPAAASTEDSAMQEAHRLQGQRSQQLHTRYTEFGLQRTESTLSSAGALPVDFLQLPTAAAAAATAAAAAGESVASQQQQQQQQQALQDTMQATLARDPTFVTTFNELSASREASALDFSVGQSSTPQAALPAIGAARPGDSLLLYVTSAVGDFDAERAAVAQLLAPRLRDCARRYGVDFCLVDTRFGCRLATDDRHWDEAISDSLLMAARAQLQHLNQLVLVGERYGPGRLPAIIPASEFEQLQQEYSQLHERLEQLRQQRQLELEEMERQRKQEEERMQQLREGDTDAESNDEEAEEQKRRQQRRGRRLSRQPQAAKPKASLNSVAKSVGRTMLMRKSKVEDSIRELEAYVPDGELLRRWYRLDENSERRQYRLAAVSSHVAEFRALRQRQQEQWAAASAQLRTSLVFCARRLADRQQLDEAESTVLQARSSELEHELELTLLRHGCRNALLFVRSFDNLRDNLQQPLAKHFTDLLPDRPEVDLHAAHQFAALRGRLEPVVPEDQIYRSQLTWTPDGGVNPQRLRVHDHYVRKMCTNVARILEPQIREIGLSAERLQQQDAGGGVAQQHEMFCSQRAAGCLGRQREVARLKSYLLSSSMVPFVVHGAAGSGKTTLAARCFARLRDWLPDAAVCCVRVVGLSSRSSNVRYLLAGVCEEILRKRRQAGGDTLPEDFAGVVNEFMSLLQQSTAQRPTVVLLDSLCQLTDEYNGRKCHWLPQALPKHVKLLLTASSGPVLSQLQQLYAGSSQEHFLELPTLPEPQQLLDSWLQAAGRRVTQLQRQWILDAFEKVPQPLLLRLCFHEASDWSSEHEPAEFGAKNLKTAVTFYLARLEAQFGEGVVRRSLAYLTASKNGLLQQELLDLLSLDEAVMETVANQFHLPVRRCPQILWLRLRRALGEFLVEKMLDHTLTLNWAHSIFKDAAADRYLTQKERPAVHKAMAEYFDGQWSGNTPKPHLGNEVGSPRFVSSQPFYFEREEAPGFVCNQRKLTELPWHLRESQQSEALKEKCLCNFDFLLAKLLGSSVRHVLDLFQSVISSDPKDKDLRLVYNSLYLSRDELEKDPTQLASQLLGRLTDIIKSDRPRAPADPKKYPFVHSLYFQCRRNHAPTLVPSRSCMTAPSEIVLELLQGHRREVTAVCMSEDGAKGFTSSLDDTIKVWDLASCRVLRTIEGVGKDVLAIALAKQETVVVTSEVACVRVFAVKQGCELFRIPVEDDPCAMTVSGDTNHIVCFHQGICVMRTWSLEKLTKVCDKQLTEKGLHQDQTIVAATRCNGDLVLYGLRGSNFARVIHCRSGNDVLKLNCTDKASVVTAVQSSREYHVVACQATDPHTRQHLFFLELFEAKSGKHVRRIKGCQADSSVQQLLLTNIQQHVISLNLMKEKNMTDIVAWNLETEEHKHFSRHPGVSNIGAIFDFRRLLTGSTADSSLRVWNVQQNMQTASSKAETVVGIADIKVDPSNLRYALVKLADNSEISVWSLAANKCCGKVVKSAKSIANHNDMVLLNGQSVVVLANPGFSPKVPNAKFVYQTLKIYDIKKQKFTVNLTNRVLIVPCVYDEYRILNNTQLMCVNELRSGFTVYSLETGEVIRKIKPDFSLDSLKKRSSVILEGSVLQREKELFEEFVKSRKGTVFMTPWDRRNETVSAKHRRYRNEWEEQKQREEELEVEKGNGITDFLLSEDNTTLVTAFFAHHLCVFNAATGNQEQVLEHRSALLHLFTASLSPDGRFLAHSLYDEQKETGQLCVWSCRSGRVKRTFAEGGVGAVAVNKDASVLLAGTEAGQLKLRDCRRSQKPARVATVSASIRFQQNSGNSIRLFKGDKYALVYARSLSIWKLQSLEMVALLTPDQPLHAIRLGLDDQLVMFATKETNDPIVLKLMSRGSQRPQRVGSIDYNEEESTDTSEDEDQPMEAEE